MTTLITVGNSEGERRCDATCHNAKGPTCVCVCGGKNHGVGLVQAMENTKQMARAMIERAAQHDERVRQERGHRTVVPAFDRKITFPRSIAYEASRTAPMDKGQAEAWLEHVRTMDLSSEPETPIPSGQAIAEQTLADL